MTIPATCPACRESYQLADEMAGKRVRCRKCQDTFDVPPFATAVEDAFQESGRRLPSLTPEDLPPVRERDRGREDDRDERRPRRRAAPPPESGNAWVWWVLGGLGALLFSVVLLCSGIIWYVSNQAGRAVDQAVQTVQNMPQPVPPPVVEAPNFNPLGEIKNLAEALAALRSPEVNQRRAARWLIHNRQEPDPRRRQEVIEALEPLLRDPDVHARTLARHAQIVWRTFR